MAKILVCGATRTEAEACRQGIRQAGLDSQFEILHCGIGPAEAAESLKARLQSGSKPSLIVSSGFAGSWSAELDIGTWISAGTLTNDLKDSIQGLKLIPGATPSHLISVPEILETPPKELTQGLLELPIAVDMESFALARVAQRAG